MNRSWGVRCVVGLLTAVLGIAGCSDKEKKSPKVRKIEGIAKHIDLKNNDVSMVFKDDRGVERELRGTIRENTEVVINGRAQKLEDIRENDRIIVTGYKDGSGDSAQLVATMIEVIRPQETDWKKAPAQSAAGTPAASTQPAGKP
ncbi:MAG: hypothetical protein HRU71_07950 [Planctomycetia bacterium]|nr:MAG: hypothetical protein HRU71_07950 [Planctomycetia bacterium]